MDWLRTEVAAMIFSALMVLGALWAFGHIAKLFRRG